MLRFSSSFALAIKSVASTSRPCEVDECGQTRARSTQLCAVSLRYLTNCAITITSKWLQAVVYELRKATIAQAIVSSAAGGMLRARSNGFDGLCQIFAFKCQRNARARVPHVKQPRLTDIASSIARAARDLAKSLFNPASSGRLA